MRKLANLWRVFKLGEAVANPAAWKTGQIQANAVTALLVALVALAKSFGYDLPITDEQLDGVAVGLLAVVNIVFTVTTSKTVGLPPRSGNPDAPADGDRKPAPAKWGNSETEL